MTTPSATGPPSVHANSIRLDTAAASIWHKSAPSAVRKALAEGNLARVWRAWRTHLTERSNPAPPSAVFSDDASALYWGAPQEWRSCPRFAPGAGRSDDAESQVLAWLAEVAGGTSGVEYAFDALDWSHQLPRLAERVSADAWFALLVHLIDTAREDGPIDGEQQPLAAQLLAGELPLTLAYLFPELSPCRALADGARKVLSAGLVDLLDGEGLVHGRHLPWMRSFLACWTRCLALSEGMKRPCLTAPARRQYAYMVRHALRFARPDGSAMLGAPGQDGDGNLLRAAVALGGRADDRAIAALMLPEKAKNARTKPRTHASLPEPASQSEWAATAMLRPDWSRTGQRLAVVYPGQTVQVELDCGKDVILHGPWSLEVTRDGRRLPPASDWEQVCWVSDDDIDYLELEIELESGVRVQRQLALARQDRVLLLADAVLGDQPGKLEYRACLSLGSGMDFRPAKESREGYLHGAKRRALVFPLALAEWRALWAAGDLQAVTTGLELTHTAQAARLYAPLFFDLDRRRFARQYTWRRLTVAETLDSQPDDAAVGYRVAIGRAQWLVYRSLAEKANRTLLGHNLSSEALLGRFDASGEVEPLIEVE